MVEEKEELAEFLAPHRTNALFTSDKREALERLIEQVCADHHPPLDRKAVFEAVWRREENFSTIVMPGIAIPHARIAKMKKTLIAVGRSLEWIAWATDEEAPVKLVILILGPEKEHLQVLSRIATRLSNEKLYQRLLEVADAGDLYELLTLPYADPDMVPVPILRKLSVTCFENALTMARKMNAGSIVLHADAAGDISFVDNYRLKRLQLIVVTRDVSRYSPCRQVNRFVAIPFRVVNRSSQVDVAFLFLVSQGILRTDERVVSVCGIPESGFLDTIMVANIKQEYRNLFPEPKTNRLPADIEPQVLSRVLQLSTNLATEGREGKPVGTLFVVGDYKEVSKYCRQMIVNPFKGYVDSDRNILDPGLEETIKEFSRIDGAFVVRGDGVIMTAGTYLRTDGGEARLLPGLGARHAAAAMISFQTRALSVVLSESTRKISLFRNGEKTLEL